jgi:hypothetical protein
MQRISQNWFVKWVLAPVAVLCALGWGYVRTNYPVCTFRYKLTAEVMTPQGVKTGSSVIEVSYAHTGDWGGGDSRDTHVNGDAVYVDLGNGKNLFITLRSWASRRVNESEDRNYSGNEKGSSEIEGLPIKLWDIFWKFGSELELCKELNAHKLGIPYSVPFKILPTLVTFDDLQTAETMRVVQPDTLEKNIGQGHHLVSVKLSNTHEPITHNIENILSWWIPRKSKWIHQGMNVNDPLIDQLGYTAFRGYQLIDDRGQQ